MIDFPFLYTKIKLEKKETLFNAIDKNKSNIFVCALNLKLSKIKKSKKKNFLIMLFNYALNKGDEDKVIYIYKKIKEISLDNKTIFSLLKSVINKKESESIFRELKKEIEKDNLIFYTERKEINKLFELAVRKVNKTAVLSFIDTKGEHCYLFNYIYSNVFYSSVMFSIANKNNNIFKSIINSTSYLANYPFYGKSFGRPLIKKAKEVAIKNNNIELIKKDGILDIFKDKKNVVEYLKTILRSKNIELFKDISNDFKKRYCDGKIMASKEDKREICYLILKTCHKDRLNIATSFFEYDFDYDQENTVINKNNQALIYYYKNKSFSSFLYLIKDFNLDINRKYNLIKYMLDIKPNKKENKVKLINYILEEAKSSKFNDLKIELNKYKLTKKIANF